MGGWMDGWVDCWMNGWMDEQVERWMNEWPASELNKLREWAEYTRVDQWMRWRLKVNRKMDGRVNEWAASASADIGLIPSRPLWTQAWKAGRGVQFIKLEQAWMLFHCDLFAYLEVDDSSVIPDLLALITRARELFSFELELQWT